MCHLSPQETHDAKRRRIPIEAKVMLINMVILKVVEYTINFTVLNKTLANTLTKAIVTCIKHSLPMKSHTK